MPADVSTRTLRHDPNRRTWAIAWFLTLALHVIAVIALQVGRQWAPSPPRETRPEPIQLTFVQPPSVNAEPKAPTYFTELPEDREDQAPERADFLSNVTSRARDRVPGGDQSLPRMSGVADAPAVGLESGKAEPKPPSTPAKQKAQQPPGADGKDSPAGPASAGGEATGFTNESTEPGNSDTRQPEMDYPEGNAEMTGDVSLSTTAWEYAPWLQRFGRRLMRTWRAPPAYYMGLIKEGGWTIVEMEITRSGEVLRMDVLEDQGHESLMRAAHNALRSCTPTEALPADFPEETLVLRVRLVYPKFRSR
jgi:hypothetical protein